MDIAPRLSYNAAPGAISVPDRLTYQQVLESALASRLLSGQEVARVHAVIATWSDAHPLARLLAWYTVQLCQDVLSQTMLRPE